MKNYKITFKANDKETIQSVVVPNFNEAKILCSEYMDNVIQEWEEQNPTLVSDRRIVDNMVDKGYYFEGFLFMRAKDGKRGYIETYIEEV